MDTSSKLFGVLVLVATISLGAWGWGNIVKLPVVSATGVGEYEVKAEKVSMVATRLDAGTTVVGAVAANGAAVDKMVAVAKNFAGEGAEIKKSNYQVNSQQGQFMVVSGLNVVSTNMATADDLVKELYTAGATTVSNVTYSPKDLVEANGRAKDEAMKEAKKEAARLAKSAGKHLGRLISVVEDTTGGSANLLKATTSKDKTLVIAKKIQVVYEIW